MDLEPSRHPSISTNHSSPSLGPVAQDSLEGIPEDDSMMDDASASNLSSSFKQQAIRNSKGKEFWETFTDENGTNRTPPPLHFLPRGSSSGISEDISLDSSSQSTPSSSLTPNISQTASLLNQPTQSQVSSSNSPSRTSTPQPNSQSQSLPASSGQGPPSTFEITRKRRRDDDLDPTSFKRRAVSPGMSVHNSPVMQSPMQRDVAPWGTRPPSNGEGMNGKNGNGGPMKRIGFQGMVDTNDGLMKMSIE